MEILVTNTDRPTSTDYVNMNLEEIHIHRDHLYLLLVCAVSPFIINKLSTMDISCRFVHGFCMFLYYDVPPRNEVVMCCVYPDADRIDASTVTEMLVLQLDATPHTIFAWFVYE